MRGIVLKSHYEPTGGLAHIVERQVPGIEVFGGVTLNLPLGGINPASVEYMVALEGGRGRIVWMPTFDAENQVRRSGEDRAYVSVSRDGELLPEVLAVIRLIAEHDLVLATGHSSAEEVLLLLHEARRQGVQRMLVTHGMNPPIDMSVAQMLEAAELGAYIEFAGQSVTAPGAAERLDRYADAIREIGPGWSILSSDLGQIDNPVPTEGLDAYLGAMRDLGFGRGGEMDEMSKRNPARLLGLDPYPSEAGARDPGESVDADLPAASETDRWWGSLPDGRRWGPTGAMRAGVDGRSIWVVDRCETGSCAGSDLPPILEFDPEGNFLRGIGAGLFVFPHGLHVDADGNIWVTDARGPNPNELRDHPGAAERGHTVVKLSPEGELLLRLGTPGVAGHPPEALTEPNAVITAANGDILVAESHSGREVGRISRFSSDGTFLESWGQRGSGPGEFIVPHDLAMDSQGRIFVADRGNYRIQILDQEGRFLDEWKQFGQPSGIDIGPDDALYVTDSHSWGDGDRADGGGYRKGIRIGSARTGDVHWFIPDLEWMTRANSGAEGITADADGNVYGAIVRRRGVEKHTPLPRLVP